MSITKWDARFLGLAKQISTWSKDPGTKCGAVITKDKQIKSLGFNGFPANCNDDIETYANRELKLERMIHAEMNALIHCPRNFVYGTLYVWPMFPCIRCAAHIAQCYPLIDRIVTIATSAKLQERWGDSIQKSRALFHECQIDWTEYQESDLVNKEI